MTIKARNIFLASAAIAFVAAQSPAFADRADPTIDFGSLKAEFAAEDAGATYGSKRRAFTTNRAQGFSAPVNTRIPGFGASNTRRDDLNTTRDWQ